MKQLKIALPDDLRAKLDEAAGNSGRSLAEEIRSRVERTFQQEGGSPPARPDIAELRKRILALVAMVEFATKKKWNEHPATAYLLELTIGKFLQRRYGTAVIDRIATSEEFMREGISASEHPTEIAARIEAYVHASLSIQRRLDEAYRRGQTEGQRMSLLIDEAIAEVTRGKEEDEIVTQTEIDEAIERKEGGKV
jgi:hypothetical protein